MPHTWMHISVVNRTAKMFPWVYTVVKKPKAQPKPKRHNKETLPLIIGKKWRRRFVNKFLLISVDSIDGFSDAIACIIFEEFWRRRTANAPIRTNKLTAKMSTTGATRIHAGALLKLIQQLQKFKINNKILDGYFDILKFPRKIPIFKYKIAKITWILH